MLKVLQCAQQNYSAPIANRSPFDQSALKISCWSTHPSQYGPELFEGEGGKSGEESHLRMEQFI